MAVVGKIMKIYLEALSEENRQLSKQLYEAVTGGNSYPSFIYRDSVM